MNREFVHTNKIAILIGNSQCIKLGGLDLLNVEENLHIVRTKL